MTSDVSASRLLPCPFCGGTVFDGKTWGTGHAKDCYMVLPARSPIETEQEIAKHAAMMDAAWNRRESRAATRAGEPSVEADLSDTKLALAAAEKRVTDYMEWLKDAEKERDHWKAKAEQPLACPTSICAAAKRDDVTCADDSCDIETGIRKPPAAGGDDVERVARALRDYDGDVMSFERYRRQAMAAIAAMKALAGGGGGE